MFQQLRASNTGRTACTRPHTYPHPTTTHKPSPPPARGPCYPSPLAPPAVPPTLPPFPSYEPESAKLLFRRGKALSLKGDHAEAEEELKRWVTGWVVGHVCARVRVRALRMQHDVCARVCGHLRVFVWVLGRLKGDPAAVGEELKRCVGGCVRARACLCT